VRDQPWDLPLRALHRIDRRALDRWHDHTRARAVALDGRRAWLETALWLALSALVAATGAPRPWVALAVVTLAVGGVGVALYAAVRCHKGARAAEAEAAELLWETACGEKHPEGRGICVSPVTHDGPHENEHGGTWR
jgi:hypothetical protein